MKKLIATTLASTVVGLAAYGQGAINFANFVPANFNAPFLLSDGTTLVPVAGYQVSLLVGTTTGNLSLVDTVGLAVPGYIGSKTETLSGIPAGTALFFVIEIWNTADGATFAAAKASGQLNSWGEFLSPTASAIPTAAPNPPGPLTGLTSFPLNSIPEPSTFALAALGAAALVVFRRGHRVSMACDARLGACPLALRSKNRRFYAISLSRSTR